MSRSRYVAQAGVIAAVYATFTVIVLQMPYQLAWGLVQLRVSEALTVLACFTPAALPGLTLGAFLANAFMLTQVGPVALLDMVFGALATLLGAAWTWHWRSRPALAMAGPVVANALIVPAYLPFILKGLGLYELPFLGISLEGHWLTMYLFGVVAIGLGEAVVVYGLGLPLHAALRRMGLRWAVDQQGE